MVAPPLSENFSILLVIFYTTTAQRMAAQWALYQRLEQLVSELCILRSFQKKLIQLLYKTTCDCQKAESAFYVFNSN